MCELDIIFHYDKAFFALNELCVGGHIVETNKLEILRVCTAQDKIEDDAKKPIKSSALSALGLYHVFSKQ